MELIQGKSMSKARIIARLTLLAAAIGSSAPDSALGGSPASGDTLVIRLVHPDQQAAEVLKLFAGARVPHPAAALAAWKRATRDHNQLGKPLEAVIAMFNPEMAREWRVMHEAEFRIELGAADGKARWYAIVPRDDGTLSAAITAMRLTDGAALAPLADEGEGIAVERLGPAGAMVSARTGDMLILGSSREELVRGLRRIAAASLAVAPNGADPTSQQMTAIPNLANHVDSGLIFDLDPGRMGAAAGTMTNRRATALLHGLGCRRIHGNLALKDELLSLEVSTMLVRDASIRPVPAARQAVVDPTWLSWVPTRDLMGVVSMALEPGAGFWDWAFAVADRIDRADPSRADAAPLRTRFNLLATAVGAKPEVDLWPHLRGVTACLIGDSSQPGHPGGALVVLHTDGDAGAERLAIDVLPRLTALLAGKKSGTEPLRKVPPSQPAGSVPAGDAYRLGTLGGRSLLLLWRGRDVLIAWGDDALRASSEAAAMPDRSVAPLCTGWVRAGKTPPQRVGAVWPARCWPSVRGLDRTTPAWRALAQGPPMVWCGWTGSSEARDSIHCSGLRQSVRRFLDQLPLDPSPLQ
jgi:hypothetical protein